MTTTAILDRRFLGELDRPGRVFEHITPNWFAAVMGTGIVANAAVSLPLQSGLLVAFATMIWVLAAVLLVTIGTAFAVHWIRHPDTARRYAADPVMSQFYGAVPMAVLTVGAGAVHLGVPLLGPTAAVGMGAVLWVAGTVLGVATSVWVPFAMMIRPRTQEVRALPAWLMPVVPPMVSATTGAALLPHVPEGQARLAMLSLCYALFGLSLTLGVMTLTMIYSRLIHGGVPAAQSAPTVWITLGMIGQSIAAANLLGAQAALVFAGAMAPIALGLKVFGIIYGLAMGGFGAAMFALATAITVRTIRQGLPFALTWWSFTFPVGTCVMGLSALGVTLNAAPIRGLADALYVVLTIAWGIVATRTVHAAYTGTVFRPA
ncbi:C4-dicarboxylate ABC transporter [Gordonia sp. SID5947]|uniref:TDT family transporter n=1 Tax=Gordonia sp. SID5947 TaxID=2690315 RepID=UPI00136A252E|nr:TDT family transporter [Gordonia sp. SID5947]MYR06336.1 C4-dicarboxylate ABC transporter [Gordonia sp. SID5947]